MNDLRGKSEPPESGHSLAGIVVGACFVLAALCAAGVYAYETWPQSPPKSVVADNRLPSSTP